MYISNYNNIWILQNSSLYSEIISKQQDKIQITKEIDLKNFEEEKRLEIEKIQKNNEIYKINLLA